MVPTARPVRRTSSRGHADRDRGGTFCHNPLSTRINPGHMVRVSVFLFVGGGNMNRNQRQFRRCFTDEEGRAHEKAWVQAVVPRQECCGKGEGGVNLAHDQQHGSIATDSQP